MPDPPLLEKKFPLIPDVETGLGMNIAVPSVDGIFKHTLALF